MSKRHCEVLKSGIVGERCHNRAVCLAEWTSSGKVHKKRMCMEHKSLAELTFKGIKIQELEHGLLL